MIQKIVSLLEKYEDNKLVKLLIQFVKFGLVGVSNTLLSLVVSYGVMGLLYIVADVSFDTMWSANLGTTLGYIVGVCNSFFWNSKYVFKDGKETDKKKAFAKTFICYGITFLLSLGIVNLCNNVLMVPAWLTPPLRLIVTIPLNFVANKIWTFKDR